MQSQNKDTNTNTNTIQISFKPLAFSGSHEDDQNKKVYRGSTQILQHTQHVDAHAFPSHFQPLSTLSSTSNSAKSKQASQPLDIPLYSFSDIEIHHTEKSKPQTFELIVAPPSQLTSSPSGDLTSASLTSEIAMSVSGAASHLSDVISNTYQDSQVHFNQSQQRLEGTAFLSNYCLTFMLYLWPVTSQSTRLEFRRASGDALAAAKFWAELKNQMVVSDDNDDEKSASIKRRESFVALDLPSLTSLPQLQGFQPEPSVSVQDLQEVAESLIRNDMYLSDDLSMLWEQLQLSTNTAKDVLAHTELMEQLICRGMINQDVEIQRFSLMILRQLASFDVEKFVDVSEQLDIFSKISGNFKQQQGTLIEKYFIQLLENSSNSSRKKFQCSQQVRQQMKEFLGNNYHHICVKF